MLLCVVRMPNYWKIRAGQRGRLWNFWKTNNIISIGWDIGKLEKLSLKEIKKKIDNEYSDNDSSQVASMLRIVTGVAKDTQHIAKGDILIVQGDAELVDIAEVTDEKYQYKNQGIPKADDHTYWRAVKYRGYKPIKIRDLPPKFRTRGKVSIHLPKTVQIYTSGKSVISELEQIMQNENRKIPYPINKTNISSEVYDNIWNLLQAKKQIILYGPPGTGKTWLARKFIEEHHARTNQIQEKKIEPEEIILPDIDGFTIDSFKFFKNLQQNNTKEWFHQNINDFRKKIDLPLRAITGAVGEYVRKIDVDLETKPNSPKTISRINRNIFGQKERDLYYNYLWSAFYRKKIGDKRKDAQLFIIINQESVRFGLGFGNHKEAIAIKDVFRTKVNEELAFFFEKIEELNITENYIFRYVNEQGTTRRMDVKTKKDLQDWLEKDNIDIIKMFSENNLPSSGKDQAKEIIKTFQELYPVYLFATSENPRETVEDYLEGTEQIDDVAVIDGLSEFVTFHQSFSYEEFIEGIRPDLCGSESEPRYKLVDGIFKKISKKAEKNANNSYFLIIDEINRGNISKIFGELITCLEKDKRLGPGNLEQENTFSVTLPYSKEEFSVPWNLYVIGTMNTADKSIALVDVALRRRFGFIGLDPDISLIKPIDVKGIPVKLPEILHSLNDKISILVDQDHRIGHSFLMNINKDSNGNTTEDPETLLKNLKIAFYYEIFPLITEYFYNDWEKIKFLLTDNFVEKEKSIEEAQEMIDDANQGIFNIKKLDREEFLNALNNLICERIM